MGSVAGDRIWLKPRYTDSVRVYQVKRPRQLERRMGSVTSASWAAPSRLPSGPASSGGAAMRQPSVKRSAV